MAPDRRARVVPSQSLASFGTGQGFGGFAEPQQESSNLSWGAEAGPSGQGMVPVDDPYVSLQDELAADSWRIAEDYDIGMGGGEGGGGGQELMTEHDADAYAQGRARR